MKRIAFLCLYVTTVEAAPAHGAGAVMQVRLMQATAAATKAPRRASRLGNRTEGTTPMIATTTAVCARTDYSTRCPPSDGPVTAIVASTFHDVDGDGRADRLSIHKLELPERGSVYELRVDTGAGAIQRVFLGDHDLGASASHESAPFGLKIDPLTKEITFRRSFVNTPFRGTQTLAIMEFRIPAQVGGGYVPEGKDVNPIFRSLVSATPSSDAEVRGFAAFDL